MRRWNYYDHLVATLRQKSSGVSAVLARPDRLTKAESLLAYKKTWEKKDGVYGLHQGTGSQGKSKPSCG
jgi:hypothetical protein